jgi:hypothetical protein
MAQRIVIFVVAVVLVSCSVLLHTTPSIDHEANIAVQQLHSLRSGMTHEEVIDAFEFPRDSFGLFSMTFTSVSSTYAQQNQL